MRAQVFLRMALAATAAAMALAFGIIADRINAAAIIGPARTTDVVKPSDQPQALERVKAEYRRPTTIPFPKDNPYTPEKALLGKKLYFDPRLSAANVLSCATCHSPAFGW